MKEKLEQHLNDLREERKNVKHKIDLLEKEIRFLSSEIYSLSEIIDEENEEGEKVETTHYDVSKGGC